VTSQALAGGEATSQVVTGSNNTAKAIAANGASGLISVNGNPSPAPSPYAASGEFDHPIEDRQVDLRGD
jgi:hypothetical protein